MLSLLVINLPVIAQITEVRLKVKDWKGKGVGEVMVESASSGASPTFTDNDGNAVLTSAMGEEIRLSVYNALEKRVTVDSDYMEIVLTPDDCLLGTGYNGFSTKYLSSASISGISGRELEGSTANQILEALYGKIPGLALYQNGSGSNPAETQPSAYIRGRGSYRDNQVLILVDGISRDASSVDVNEVESVTVLKDAASLALYGIRGANGAILITTRRGGNHKSSIDIGYRFGVQTPFRVPEMADADEYAAAVNEAMVNDGLRPYYPDNGVSGNPIFANIDWKDLIMRNWGYDNDLHVSLDGSAKMVKYYVYADYTGNRGFFNNTEIIDGCRTQKRYDALKVRTNLDIRVTPTTDVLVNLAARIEQSGEPIDGTSLEKMYHAPATGFPVQYENIWANTGMFANPVKDILGKGNATLFSRKLSADLTIRQSLGMLTEGLSAEVRIAYDNAAVIRDQKAYNSSYYTFSPITGEDGRIKDYQLTLFGNETELKYSSWLNSQYMHIDLWGKIGWKRGFGGHNIDAALIFNRERHTLSGANNSYVHHDWILSATYDWKSRYLASVTANYSASSRMPKGDKFRLFPAVSLGWLISEEPFLKGNSIVNHLKIRGSYGITGMDSVLDYDMDIQFNGGGYGFSFISPNFMAGAQEGALPSTGIQPETERKMDIGLEFRLLKHLSGEVSLFSNARKYIRTTAANTVSGVLGIGMSDTFNGKTANKGLEASLAWTQSLGDFSYALRGNFSMARNTITGIDEEFKPHGYMYRQGHSIGQFYGLTADGFYQASDFDAEGNLLGDVVYSTFGDVQPGDVKYKDLNGDGKIDNYDFSYMLKTDLPEIYYGFGIELGWKGLGLSAWFQGAASYVIPTTLGSIYQPLHGGNKNISRHYLEDYWTADNTAARYPRLTTLDNKNNYQTSSLWTVDGGYLKLRDLEIHWDLPKSFAGRMKMDNARLYLRGRNLFSVDNVRILDPEAVNFNYPTARFYTIGINVTF